MVSKCVTFSKLWYGRSLVKYGQTITIGGWVLKNQGKMRYVICERPLNTMEHRHWDREGQEERTGQMDKQTILEK